MKYLSVVALAAASSAFVVPDAQVFNSLEVESRVTPPSQKLVEDIRDIFRDVRGEVNEALSHFGYSYEKHVSEAKATLDSALSHTENVAESVKSQLEESYFDATSWLDDTKNALTDEFEQAYTTLDRPHHRKPPHHHHRPNQTVYELIASSKYTTKLAKLIGKYDDLVEALNGTSANFTVFAPTNSAFEKIPDDAPEPSKEFLKALLTYHVSPEFYPAGRILVSRTIPTLLNSSELGSKPFPQRLVTNIGFKGLTINFYSRVVAADIFGTNGVIHGVDSFIIPPPRALKIIDLLPSEFSTLELGLGKTGLLEALNSTKHEGGTLFAPNNFAFTKLGPRINAFLFSSHGLKYLKALLSYHVAPGKTLYSDAFYDGASDSSVDKKDIPKGAYHVDLETLLEGRSLSIDIGRYGRLIDIKINGYNRVSVADGVARDGVIHVVSSVIIPPKKLSSGETIMWNGEEEMSVEDLKERLEPFVHRPMYSEDL